MGSLDRVTLYEFGTTAAGSAPYKRQNVPVKTPKRRMRLYEAQVNCRSVAAARFRLSAFSRAIRSRTGGTSGCLTLKQAATKPSNQHLVSDRMLTRFRERSARNPADFLTYDLRRCVVPDKVVNEMFTTGSGTKTRGCKLSNWRALQDSYFRRRGVAEIPNELETAGRGHSDSIGMARPAGLEPATSWFVARRSIQLS